MRGNVAYEYIGKLLAKEGKYTSACVCENIQPVLTKSSTLHEHPDREVNTGTGTSS